MQPYFKVGATNVIVVKLFAFRKIPTLRLGDLERACKLPNILSKGDTTNWSNELSTLSKISMLQCRPVIWKMLVEPTVGKTNFSLKKQWNFEKFAVNKNAKQKTDLEIKLCSKKTTE